MRVLCGPNISCAFNFTKGAEVAFDADPDIAGIGVIVSFFISAWLAYAIALLTYLLFGGVLDDNGLFVTRFDREMRATVKSVFQKMPFANALMDINKRLSRDLMQKVCLMFSDQQLITGASILMVGYSRHCDISQYHFYIAANLSMACFSTFQALLPIIRNELDDKLKRGWRMVWISAIFACVLPLNFVIYNDNFYAEKHFGHSMHCIWRKLPEHFRPQLMPYVVLGTVIDVWSFYTIVLYMYPELRERRPLAYLRGILRSLFMLSTWLYLQIQDREHLRERKYLWILVKALARLLFVVAFTLRELLGSVYVDLARVFFYLIQSTNSVGWARRKAHANGRKGSEDTWGFGQILPMLLLALPTFAFIEALISQYLDHNPLVLRLMLRVADSWEKY